jgi:cysteine desulfurase
MNQSRYFDHAATSPMAPQVLEAMLPYLGEEFGNANSTHSFGRRAMDAVEHARFQLAAALSSEAFEVAPEQIIFTSGATESNNWVLRSFERVAISPFEHSSMREPALALGKCFLTNVGHALTPSTEPYDLVSVMSVNNETGARYDVREIPARTRHADITQSAVKYETDLGGIDFASLSAHKFNGPKGVGALFTASGSLPPLLIGGEQEHGFRGGTLNVPGIVGMGAAAELGMELREPTLKSVLNAHEAFLNSLDQTSGVQINSPDDGAPHVLNVSYEGLEGESLVIGCDAAGFAISSGAACSSHSTEPSHVLVALGIDPDWIRGTVRISFGAGNGPDIAADLAITLNAVARSLRHLNL